MRVWKAELDGICQAVEVTELFGAPTDEHG